MKSLLIRAEDKNQWERRAPLVPQDLEWLIKTYDISACVQHSEKRVFTDNEYATAGATVCDDMSAGDVIFGIKEIPVEKILADKTYIFFSHTIKGQQENMALLKKIIDANATLIDYEKIIDKNRKRIIYFGPYAGNVGAIDILWLLGEYWQHQGLETPLREVQQATLYKDLNETKARLRQIGDRIQVHGFPKNISPIVIGILGYGNVSKGAQSIFDCLPVHRVEPGELPKLTNTEMGNSHNIYLTVFEEKHLVSSRDGRAFNLQHYYEHPEYYKSAFDKYLPYLTILVNAIYWEERYPKFVTWNGLQTLSKHGQLKLNGIADISCDVNGSIECNVRATTSGAPAYRCLPQLHRTEDGHKGEGIVILAVDNLPAELPVDASVFFSKKLRAYVPALLDADFTKPLCDSGLPSELQRAVIVQNGELMPDYKYLTQYFQS